MRVHAIAVAAVSLVLPLLLGGCSPEDPEESAPLPSVTSSSPTGADLSDATFWLSFEEESIDFDGATVYPDALDGPFDGRVVTANGGGLTVVPGAGSARAISFPEKCDQRQGCPRALLEIPPDPALDPGLTEFEYGASVWLAPDQTTEGSNIVQKGRFGAEGGLWKLQVDGDEGRPSCVIRSGSDIVTVRSGVSVADSDWHHVVCRRDSDGVSIEVDGTVERRGGPTGSVSSSFPVRVGSPGVGDRDDQFHGRIDDVYLRIGS